MLMVVRIQLVSNEVLQITNDEESHVALSKCTTRRRDFTREKLLESSLTISFFCLYSKLVSCPHISFIFRRSLWFYNPPSIPWEFDGIFNIFSLNWCNCSSGGYRGVFMKGSVCEIDWKLAIVQIPVPFLGRRKVFARNCTIEALRAGFSRILSSFWCSCRRNNISRRNH